MRKLIADRDRHAVALHRLADRGVHWVDAGEWVGML
jgi:hypothetical protein